jgi:hypothetical protein
VIHKDHRFESDTWFTAAAANANEIAETEKLIASEIACRRTNARENIAMSAPRQLIEGTDATRAAVAAVRKMLGGAEFSVKKRFNLGSFAKRSFGHRRSLKANLAL